MYFLLSMTYCHLAMIGPTLIPIVNYMGSEMIVMPLIIMGILLIFGGLARFDLVMMTGTVKDLYFTFQLLSAGNEK